VRRRAVFLVVLALAGCGEPEPSPLERARARDAELQAARAQAKDREEAIEKQRLGLGPSPIRSRNEALHWKQDLLNEYGARLTPLQRSALVTAELGSREEGEALCKKWTAENEAFDRGGR
jgi:hypothetical protein